MSSRRTSLHAACWLPLALLLIPLSASAQRRRANEPSAEDRDPVCRRTQPDVPCWKIRLELQGGGFFTTESLAPVLGLKLGFGFPLPAVELGVQAIVASRLRTDAPTSGSAEAVVRVPRRLGDNGRAFLDLSAGVAMSDPIIEGGRFSPSASVGGSFEFAANSSGLSLSVALTVMRQERWTAFPHAGVGFFF